jgi:hypothetical protein
MRTKNPLQVEQMLTPIMPRILISYYRKAMTPEEYRLVSHLMTDLFSLGINVLIDEIQDINKPLALKLQADDWLLLVQTQDISTFELVKQRLAKALDQYERPPIQRIRHLLVSALPPHGTISTSDMPITFDASIDYPRAFAELVLTLYPNSQTHLYGIERGAAPLAPDRSLSDVTTDAFSRARRFAGSRRPLHRMLLVLIVLILLGGIITVSLILPLVGKTTNKRPIHSTTMTATRTTQATINPKTLYTQITSQMPAINDSLQSQSANRWDVGQQEGESCAFTNGSYHVSILPPAQPPQRYVCLAHGPVFANLALQVGLKLLQGDVGGVVFRANGNNSYYWFSLDANGCYRLVLLPPNDPYKILLDDQKIAGQKSCRHALNMQNTNQLTALAQGSNIYLYINGVFANQFSDSSLTRGQIGLLAVERTNPTDVAFTNLKVWRLP